MKLMHLSDLHLGKRVNEFSMLEDQAYILAEILRMAERERPGAVLIAGDIYDKPTPPTEAVRLFDDFLCALSARGMQVLLISGNHDSSERIAFGARLMDASGIHIAPPFRGETMRVTLRDAHGPVCFYLLPFLRPAHVRAAFPEEDIATCTDAIRTVVGHMRVNPAERNVLVAHQFVTGAQTTEVEDVSVGGADNVDAACFDVFDYVALGHIHGPQYIGRNTLRYCGSPLKYSFSECHHVKSVTMVELEEKGQITVRELPLTPLRDMREVRGTYEQLTLRSGYEGTPVEDYLHVVLTDEEDVPDAMARLRVIYPNLMKLDYDNTRTRASADLGPLESLHRKSELELFDELYKAQNGRSMSDTQRAYVAELLREIKEENA